MKNDFKLSPLYYMGFALAILLGSAYLYSDVITRVENISNTNSEVQATADDSKGDTIVRNSYITIKNPAPKTGKVSLKIAEPGDTILKNGANAEVKLDVKE